MFLFSKNRLNLLLFGIAVFYLVVAYNSSGYHNPDEHYQILEFTNYKLGKAYKSDLAWEFEAHIRSGLQPLIGYLIFKACYALGITNVYTLAFILRAVTALFSIAVIGNFIKSSKPQINDQLFSCFVFLSYLLWFLPYINVRFSSETWSGLFFLIALTQIQFEKYRKSVGQSLFLGLVFGISILFRYQSALLVMGTLFWFFWVEKLEIRKIAMIILAIILVLVLGFFVDKWLYGVYSFTVYNYFYFNIIKGVSLNYGTAPWYEMMIYILKAPGPFGIFIFISFVVLAIYHPKNVMVWSLLPFLIVHSIVAHKELRFLFPVANLAPLVLMLSFQHVYGKAKFNFRYLKLFIAVGLIIANLAGLIAIASRGAGTTKVAVSRFIRDHYKNKKVNILFTDGLNPYEDWAFPNNTFYHHPPGALIKKINSVWQENLTQLKEKGCINLVVISDDDITGPKTTALLKKLNLMKVYQSIPCYVQKINIFYKGTIHTNNIMLYEFRN